MSGDPEQEYFADGMVDEIITALSRIRWLFVIARNSSFTYKGQAVDVKQIGRELGVRYVLEGSVRKAGGRVRNRRTADRCNQRHTYLGRPLRPIAWPLYVKLELRAMTKSQRIRESAVMISSTIPSAKYSWSGSPLMF
jgi:hypothetical protein